MSVSNFFFGENIPLLQLEKFSQEYTLNVENTFLMGKENSPISLKTSSELLVDQHKETDFIYNRVNLLKITGDTEDHALKFFCCKVLPLLIFHPIFISNEMQTERYFLWRIKMSCGRAGKNGKSISWHQFSGRKDQVKLVANYEKGLKSFEGELKKNLQYILLLPEVYSLIFPPNEYYSFLSSPLSIRSRLVQGVEYSYQLKLVKLEEENNTLFVEFHAVLNNREELIKSHIKKLYENEKNSLLTSLNSVSK